MAGSVVTSPIGITGYRILLGFMIMLHLLFPVRAHPEEPLGVTFDGESTSYRVWAPNAKSVAVIGSFNGWRPRRTDYLTLDPATGIWSGTIPRTRPRGAYQFLINDKLVRRDPYARAVSEDQTQSLHYDRKAFNWSGARPPRYPLEDLILYQIHMGTFHVPRPDGDNPGTFDDAIQRLDHLARLGINTVCVMPVHEFFGDFSYGYNPCDLFAVEQAYGGADGFKRFVDAAHKHGLSVHLDIVHSHYGARNLDLLQFDGTGGRTSGGIYFYEGDDIGMTPWGPRPRFAAPMVQRFIRDNLIMWLEEYRVDGFRWHSTLNIRAFSDGKRLIPAGAQLLRDLNDMIREDYPGRWSVAEDSLNIGNFHASWDHDFYLQVVPSLTAQTDDQRDMESIARALNRAEGMWRVVYVDTHDTAAKRHQRMRIASKVDADNPGGDYARRMSGLGAVLTFTAPGIPMIFMGNEFQESGSWHFDTPLDWSNARKHMHMVTLHRDLIALRRNLGGFSNGLRGRRVDIPLVDDDKNHIVYWRGHEDQPEDQVVVALNLSGQPSDIVIPFPSQGPWVLRLNTDWPAYGGATRHDPAPPFTLPASAKGQTTMAPYSARIYSLAERPTDQVPEPEEPPEEKPVVEADTGPFSIWRAINLSGDFNEWSLTEWPFELVENHVWEGRFMFEAVENPSFRIVGNNTDYHWGRQSRRPVTGDTVEETLIRDGHDFNVRETWDGAFVFRFNAQTLTMEIERVGDEFVEEDPIVPEEEEKKEEDEEEEPYRIWTSDRGSTTEARLIEATAEAVTLQDPDGREYRVPLNRFSEPDRAYILEWLESNR